MKVAGHEEKSGGNVLRKTFGEFSEENSPGEMSGRKCTESAYEGSINWLMAT